MPRLALLAPLLSLSLLAQDPNGAAPGQTAPEAASRPAARAPLRSTLALPMAYLALNAGLARGADGALPMLDLLLPASGADDGASPDGASPDGASPDEATQGAESAGPALGLIRGLLARAQGEIELALLGVLPSEAADEDVGLPLVVLRVDLGEAAATRLASALQAPDLACPLRTVHGFPTYVLQADAAQASPRRLPVEFALTGDVLYVANTQRGLEEALDRSTSAGRDALDRDPRFAELMQRLDRQAGSLQVFVDWQRLSPRLATVTGMPGSLLASSGLGAADALAAVIAVEPASRREGQPSAWRLRTQALVAMAAGRELDGWLLAVAPATARQMFDDAPMGGLGGLVFSVEPQRLLAHRTPEMGHDHDHDHGHDHDHFHRHGGRFGDRLAAGFRERGMDLVQIVSRLGQRGAIQMLLLPGDAAPSALRSAFAVQAKSRKAAAEVFGALADSAQPAAKGRKQGGHPVEALLPDVGGVPTLRAFVVEDWLCFAEDAQGPMTFAADARERSRRKTQVESAIQRALRAFASDRSSRHGGLLHCDLRSLQNVASPRAGDGLLALPLLSMLHAGVIDVEAGDDRTLVHLRLLSSR